MPRGHRRTTRAVTMPVLHPQPAGVDIDATELDVCVPLDRDPQPHRRFGPFTEDLLALAAWLAQCGVTSVAMESTGVYWIPLGTRQAPGRRRRVSAGRLRRERS